MSVFQKIAAWVKWNRLGMSLRSRGVLGTASHFLERLADRRFDARHHVETTAKVPPYALGVESASHANEYTPVPTSGLSRVLADLPIDYREWDFVDIGAGKGRALFVAARFAFQRIIGVELSSDLVHLARRNILSYRDPRQKCFDLTVTHEDAQRYQFWGSTTAGVILYLFDPFNDVAAMEQMLENVQKWLEGGDHKLYVIYWHSAIGGTVQTISSSKAGPSHLRVPSLRGLAVLSSSFR